MLFEELDIDRDVAEERGYYTARNRSEVPEAFKHYQRKAGLVVPMYSPDGETVGYQLRPDRPRKGGPKYETPGSISPVVDVHPRMLEEARHGSGPLLITEGAKTGDAATSRGIATVVLAGVWMWCVPRVRPYRLKACFDHIRLEDREVFVAFDSDCMSKANVQDALAALVVALKARGASLKVIYLPDAADGSKQGIDDYLVAGGTIREMFMLAREFDPADVGRIRMSRDEKLRRALEELRAAWWGADWNRFVGAGEFPHWARGHSARDVEDALLRLAARRGKLTPEGLQLTHTGVREIADEAARSKPSTIKAIRHLEAEARLHIHEPEGGRKARSYTLLAGRADLYHKGNGGAAAEGKATRELQRCDPSGKGLRDPDVPRLRWPSPAQRPRKVLLRSVPRNTWGTIGEYRERIERLGPHRGAVVDTLEASAGELPIAKLCEILHRKRPRDVKRRTIPPLQAAGVVEVSGDVVRLTADWRANLEAERERSGEIATARRQAERHRDERELYRKYGPPPPAEDPPPLMGPEKVEEIVREREKEDLETRIEDQRRKVGFTVETFVFDKLKELGQIRLALLMEVYEDAGGDPWEVPPALRRMGCRIERLPEFENRQFVFPPAEGAA